MGFRPDIGGEALRFYRQSQMKPLGFIYASPTTDPERTMRYGLPLLSILLLTSACTHVRAPEVAPSEMRADINRQAHTKTAVIQLRDQTRVPAEGLYVGPDTASWFHAETGAFHQAATHEIQKVQFARRGSGAVLGAVGGIAAGLIVGRVLAGPEIDEQATGQQVSEACGEGPFVCAVSGGLVKAVAEGAAKMARAVTIGLGGLVGGGMGAGVGAATGAPVVYFLDEPAPRSSPALTQSPMRPLGTPQRP